MLFLVGVVAMEDRLEALPVGEKREICSARVVFICQRRDKIRAQDMIFRVITSVLRVGKPGKL